MGSKEGHNGSSDSSYWTTSYPETLARTETAAYSLFINSDGEGTGLSSQGTAALARSHPKLTAWQPKAQLDRFEWIAAGRRLGAMSRSSQWWVGDWVRYGTERWGEKYAEAARITGYDVHSLRNMAYVASRFDLSRRRDNLTWSHHAEVAAFEPGDQELWLDRASGERLSVSDLRIELRTARRADRIEAPEDDADPPDTASLVCPHCGHQLSISELHDIDKISR